MEWDVFGRCWRCPGCHGRVQRVALCMRKRTVSGCSQSRDRPIAISKTRDTRGLSISAFHQFCSACTIVIIHNERGFRTKSVDWRTYSRLLFPIFLDEDFTGGSGSTSVRGGYNHSKITLRPSCSPSFVTHSSPRADRDCRQLWSSRSSLAGRRGLLIPPLRVDARNQQP